MTADGYLRSILSKYTVNEAGAKAAGQAIYPVLQGWGGTHLLGAEFSGSIAKGTAISLATDADIFLSLSSATPTTLQNMYNTLANAVRQAGYPSRLQNVSIAVTVNGFSIDLVPGKRQSQFGNDHSLYLRKSGTWTKTNVSAHISHVAGSGRLEEIRVLKVWRKLYNLEFPSFHLELATIDALANARHGNLAENVYTALQFIRSNIVRSRYVDPANTNNVVSDDCTLAEKTAIAAQAALSCRQQNWGGIVW